VRTTTSRARLALLACLAAATCSVAIGCGESEDATSQAGAAAAGGGDAAESAKPLEGKTIAYIKAGDIEYYTLSAKGAEDAIRALGGTPKLYNSAFDPQKELANVNDAIAQKVDGIVLFPLSDASTKAELRLAKRADIPVSVLYGYTDAVKDQAAGFVQINFYNYAKALGEAFASEVPSGDIALISGQQGRSEVTAFKDGFLDGFGDRSRLVEEIAADYDRQKAFNAAQDIIQKHPGLKGLVVGNEDMAIGAAKALGSRVADVAIATQNGSPEGNDYLEQGKFRVTVGGSPSQEAAIAVRMLASAVAGSPAAEPLCQTPWALNRRGDIKSVDWVPTPSIISAAVEQPPPCSAT
jgi:ribose transport system substrate-binding protein